MLHEALRSGSRRAALDVNPPAALIADPSGQETLAQHLENCLGQLPVPGRDLVLSYYSVASGRTGIESRRRLAGKLGLSDNALRSRVQRLRDRLEDCVRRSAGEREPGARVRRSHVRHDLPADDTDE